MKRSSYEPKKLGDVVKEHVLLTLGRCDGDKKAAAEKLGIPLDEIERIIAKSDDAQ